MPRYMYISGSESPAHYLTAEIDALENTGKLSYFNSTRYGLLLIAGWMK